MIFEDPAINEFLPLGSSEESQYKTEVIKDLWICFVSREASLTVRREVLTGKAKFGITGDGKELAQVAMARAYRKGDYRAGYYRDQTLIFALGLASVEEYFAQLYTDFDNDPFSAGRQMNCHFATPFVDDKGEWLDLRKTYNISSDVSCTAGQMARALGIALASKRYRDTPSLANDNRFSNKGDEVCFCTIGDASTSEGAFWETVNAACVMQVPLSISVWDDGYGISVPVELQTTKGSISEALKGFSSTKEGEGLTIYKVDGSDYVGMCSIYDEAIAKTRKEHKPSLIHVYNITQPQGHSTSGSHERYKSKERLAWEKEHDCIEQFILWIIKNDILDTVQIETMRQRAKEYVRNAKSIAWKNSCGTRDDIYKGLRALYQEMDATLLGWEPVAALKDELEGLTNPFFAEVFQNARRLENVLRNIETPLHQKLKGIIDFVYGKTEERYHSHLYSETSKAAINVPIVPVEYDADAKELNGFQILNTYFDKVFEKIPNLFAFGEDVGHIGDVNQGLANLQAKYGEERIFDSGIREWTIMGQAIGMAMRGLRPIGEIQYLDYLVYALAPLTDDLATLRYRTNGIQMAPAIIRTRGHRLEGIWHAGSPMGMLLGSLQGMYIMTPRNMVQAIGFYNTMLRSDDPGLIIECLNGYRQKERLPRNYEEFTIPLGVPEIMNAGTDVTLVTYGSCVRVAQEALKQLRLSDIEVELIDVQTLIPFDLEGLIVDSLSRTNRVIFMDEDIPGGGTAYMMQQVLEVQGGYRYLDSPPVTLSAKSHRTSFGSEGDYFCKPNAEDVYNCVYNLVIEADQERFI